jgi:hypothetical protein
MTKALALLQPDREKSHRLRNYRAVKRVTCQVAVSKEQRSTARKRDTA